MLMVPPFCRHTLTACCGVELGLIFDRVILEHSIHLIQLFISCRSACLIEVSVCIHHVSDNARSLKLRTIAEQPPARSLEVDYYL